MEVDVNGFQMTVQVFQTDGRMEKIVSVQYSMIPEL